MKGKNLIEIYIEFVVLHVARVTKEKLSFMNWQHYTNVHIHVNLFLVYNSNMCPNLKITQNVLMMELEFIRHTIGLRIPRHIQE